MNTARQAIRWTIPGWLFFLFLLVFDGVALVFGHRPMLWKTVVAEPNLSIALAAAGLPTGYLIFQVYFWVYWVFPFPKLLGLQLPRDRGRMILKDVTDVNLRDMVGRALDMTTPETPTKRWWIVKYKDPKVMERYRHNWLLQNFIWRKTLIENNAESLEATAVHYSDIYHSLGAARWSLVLAFLLHASTYVCTVLVPHLHSPMAPRSWLTPISNLVLAIILFAALTVARYDTLTTLIQFKHDFITYFHRSDRRRENQNSDLAHAIDAVGSIKPGGPIEQGLAQLLIGVYKHRLRATQRRGQERSS